MKSAYSLLELVFVLVILALIGSYAIPKYMNTRDMAIVTTIKRDVFTILNSIQAYYLLHGKTDEFNKMITFNTNKWEINKNTILFKSSNKTCISIKLDNENKELKLNIDETVDNICKKLSQAGIKNSLIKLY